MARSTFRHYVIVMGALLASSLAGCSYLSKAVQAPVAQAPATQEAVQAAPKPAVVVVRVPAETPSPAISGPALPYPTLPGPAAAPQVTVNPAQVVVEASKSITSIRIPWGDYTLDLLNVVWTAFGGAALMFARKYLAQAPVIVQAGVAMAGGVDSIVQQLHDVAVNSIEGATKNKALDLNVSSQVLAKFLQLGIDKGPDFIASVGGVEGLKDKFMAVAHLGEDVSAERLQAAQAV